MGVPATYSDGSRLHGFSQADALLFTAKLTKDLLRAPYDKELTYFLAFCWRHQLDPIMEHVTAQARSDKMAITIGIGGLVLMAERSGAYAGCDAVEYGPQGQEGKVKYPEWARVTVYRMVQGQRCPFTAKVLWDEYAGRTRDGRLKNTWASLPYTMLGKVATAHALRLGFSANVGRVYIPEEMEQADNRQPEQIDPAAAALALEGAMDDDDVAPEMTSDGAPDAAPEDDVAADDAAADEMPASAPAPAPRAHVLAPGERTVTDQQRRSLQRLCGHIGRPEPDYDTLGYARAGELIQQYSQAWAALRDQEAEA